MAGGSEADRPRRVVVLGRGDLRRYDLVRVPGLLVGLLGLEHRAEFPPGEGALPDGRRILGRRRARGDRGTGLREIERLRHRLIPAQIGRLAEETVELLVGRRRAVVSGLGLIGGGLLGIACEGRRLCGVGGKLLGGTAV